jgi:hypothetical protein
MAAQNSLLTCTKYSITESLQLISMNQSQTHKELITVLTYITSAPFSCKCLYEIKTSISHVAEFSWWWDRKLCPQENGKIFKFQTTISNYEKGIGSSDLHFSEHTTHGIIFKTSHANDAQSQ